MLSVSLLGDFRIQYNDVPLTDVDTPRLQSLLAYLILHCDAPQSRAHLAFLFWPDTTEAQARTNLRNLLHHLRHTLPDADSYLDAGGQTLQWLPGAAYSLDVAGFEAALAQAAQAGGPAAAREALERAVAAYKGDLLPSCYDDWILPLREGLRQAYLDALEQLVGLLDERRDYRAAITYAQRLLRHDPLHEATYRNLIRLHALDSDRAGALRVYHTCNTVLQRELGVEPSAATRHAYEQLLGAETSLSPAVPAATAVSAMVGREMEWRKMLQAWRGLAAGAEPHAVLLCGEAGIGKTRLLEELVQWAVRQGLACAAARCYAAEGELAYAPVTAWLRAHPPAPIEDVWLAEVARLLPELLARLPDLPRPGALTEAWQRERLFEGLSRAILGHRQPLLLAIDDLHWCDRDSLEWLHFLLRFDRGARLLVAGTYRPEEIGEGHPLVSWLQALRHAGQVTEVELRPLDEAATKTLASHVAGAQIDPGTAQRIYLETEGNPLFVVETVRAELAAQSRSPLGGTPPWLRSDRWPLGAGLPPKVQAVLEARLGQLSPPARELAGVAATIGREFSFRLLAYAGSLDEDALVRALDELWRRRIVREHGADAYDFSHDKLREVAYMTQSAARRRTRHRAAAEALRALHKQELDPVSHQVAVHYERAGLPEEALPYYLRAAEVARRVYANEEAIALFRHGLTLLEADGGNGSPAEPSVDGRRSLTEPNSRGEPEIAARLWEGLGDVLELTARHDEARHAFLKALAEVPGCDPIGQARLHSKTGAVLREQRLYAQALEACRRAESALGKQPEGEAGGWWAVWLQVQVDRIWTHYWLAQWREMDELVHRLQPVAQDRGGASNRMRLLWASSLMHLRRDRYVVSDEMLADAREGLAASRESGDLKTRIDWQFELGFLHLWRRELHEAEEHLQSALQLLETAGILPMRTLCLTYLTVVRRFRGWEDGVLSFALRALEAAEASHMPDYVAAARANQAWLAWSRHDMPAAEQAGQEALELWRQSPLVYPFQWLALWPLVSVALARGREDAALAHAQALLEPTQQRLPNELNTALESAVQVSAEGGARAVRPHLARAVEVARELGYL